MGTFHSFISEPLKDKEDAKTLLKELTEVIERSDYRNSAENFSIVPINNQFVVIGIYKNLGSIPVELIMFTGKYAWATVSDEYDFYNSNL